MPAAYRSNVLRIPSATIVVDDVPGGGTPIGLTLHELLGGLGRLKRPVPDLVVELDVDAKVWIQTRINRIGLGLSIGLEAVRSVAEKKCELLDVLRIGRNGNRDVEIAPGLVGEHHEYSQFSLLSRPMTNASSGSVRSAQSPPWSHGHPQEPDDGEMVANDLVEWLIDDRVQVVRLTTPLCDRSHDPDVGDAVIAARKAFAACGRTPTSSASHRGSSTR